MMAVVFAETTERIMQRLATAPPQSLLLSGPSGIGLHAAASWLANSNQQIDVVDDDGAVSIQSIQLLYRQTRARRTSPQWFIVNNADELSHPAQNALLKIIEEPPTHCHIVLLSHAPERLLATVRSRVTHVALQQISRQQSIQLLEPYNLPDDTAQQLLFLASGLPAELHRLASDADHRAAQSDHVIAARDYLRAPIRDRLLSWRQFADLPRDSIQLRLRLIARLLYEYSDPSPAVARQLATIEFCQRAIDANGNAKLQLLRLITSAQNLD